MSIAPAVNAGVHSGTGFEFQKHCALFVYLNDYKDKFANSQYFLCLEHHDDFMFCFHDMSGEINYISAFQAKKSSASWGMGNDEMEIINKLLHTGEELIADTAPKTKNYSHRLQFATNNTIKWSVKGASKAVKGIKYTINESNDDVQFKDLPPEIAAKLKSSLLEFNPTAPLKQIDNLAFIFFDIGRSAEAQRNQLIGVFDSVFGKTIADHSAAVDALLLLFKRVELTFNQGNTAKLLDPKKRIGNTEFADVLNIISTKQKAYQTWRECGQQVSQKLKISVLQKQSFETDIQNCFDYFKDPEMIEHRRILEFVKINEGVLQTSYTDEDCIAELYTSLLTSKDYDLEELQIKAALFAAYIEVRGLQ